MKNTIALLIICTSLLLLCSFSSTNDNAFICTYGICDDESSAILLTIRADETFYYHDYSDPAHKITATGTWSLNGRKVILKSNDTNQDFHDTWTFDERGLVAKSHKGLSFYKLVALHPSSK